MSSRSANAMRNGCPLNRSATTRKRTPSAASGAVQSDINLPRQVEMNVERTRNVPRVSGSNTPWYAVLRFSLPKRQETGLPQLISHLASRHPIAPGVNVISPLGEKLRRRLEADITWPTLSESCHLDLRTACPIGLRLHGSSGPAQPSSRCMESKANGAK